MEKSLNRETMARHQKANELGSRNGGSETAFVAAAGGARDSRGQRGYISGIRNQTGIERVNGLLSATAEEIIIKNSDAQPKIIRRKTKKSEKESKSNLISIRNGGRRSHNGSNAKPKRKPIKTNVSGAKPKLRLAIQPQRQRL